MHETLVHKLQRFRNWFQHEHLFIDQVVHIQVVLIMHGMTEIACFCCQGFDQEAWIRHRSWRRHMPEGFTFVRVFHSLGYPVFFYIGLAFLVCGYAQWAEVCSPLYTLSSFVCRLQMQLCNST